MKANFTELQRWADHYRLFAKKAKDPKSQARFREMAEEFERRIEASRTSLSQEGDASPRAGHSSRRDGQQIDRSASPRGGARYRVRRQS
jgi:hypothetical protein